MDSAHAERRRIKDASHQGLVGRKLREEWLVWREDSTGSIRVRQSAKKAKGMRLREKTRLESARIKAARSSFQPYGITKIEVLDDRGQWVEQVTQKGVVQGFVKEALHRGSQTKNTPFMLQPLLDDFGISPTSPAVSRNISLAHWYGSICCQVVASFEDAGSGGGRTKNTVTFPERIVCAELVPHEGIYGNWTSGLHFGHFKVMNLSPLSTDIYSGFAEIPYKSGFSPKRLRKCVDHMLQKSPDNFHADRFRPINFLEADANYNLKHIARAAMAYGESMGIIANEQYGSRKDHSSETQALNKRLTFDDFERHRGVLCVNDAKSCYDRILHVIAAICLRRFGLEQGPIASMVETLQYMTHLIHIAWGI